MSYQHDWNLVAVPRKYAPAWLWSWIPHPYREWICGIQPFAWLLFRRLPAHDGSR